MKPKLPDDLLSVLGSMQRPAELSRLLSDLFTPAEIEAVGERWSIVKLLAAGHPQRVVRDQLGVSIGTVSRGARQLRYGDDGFALAFDALEVLAWEIPARRVRRRDDAL